MTPSVAVQDPSLLMMLLPAPAKLQGPTPNFLAHLLPLNEPIATDLPLTMPAQPDSEVEAELTGEQSAIENLGELFTMPRAPHLPASISESLDLEGYSDDVLPIKRTEIDSDQKTSFSCSCPSGNTDKDVFLNFEPSMASPLLDKLRAVVARGAEVFGVTSPSPKNAPPIGVDPSTPKREERGEEDGMAGLVATLPVSTPPLIGSAKMVLPRDERSDAANAVSNTVSFERDAVETPLPSHRQVVFAPFVPSDATDVRASQSNVDAPTADVVVEQLVRHVKFATVQGRSEMNIALEPKELGHLRMEIKIKDDALAVVFRVENEDVKSVIQSNISELKEALSLRGVVMERVEVYVKETIVISDVKATANNGSDATYFGAGTFDGSMQNGRQGQSPQPYSTRTFAHDPFDSTPSHETMTPSPAGHQLVDCFA